MKEPKIGSKKQFARFALVGGVSTVIDFGLLFIGTMLGLPAVAANIISTGVAFIFSFFANKKYTFKATDGNIVREITLFIAVTLFGLWVIQTAIIHWLMPSVLNMLHNQELALFVSKLVATSVTLFWNYILYNAVVFKDR